MPNLQAIETQKSFKYLQEVETLAQDILTTKQSKLEAANAQNKFREALRALETVDDRRTWMKVGTIYVERPTIECKHILRDEVKKAETDVSVLDRDIRDKVHRLRDLEHAPRLEGFNLKPISVAEAKVLHKSFGAAN